MATKYWTGSQWVLNDGSTTTAPGIGDEGVLGGALTGVTLPQSGIVSFFGETTTDIGVLMVEGTGPWTIEGTGGTDSTIDNLIVAMGATVTVQAPIAVGANTVQSVVVQQVPGITTPATVTLGDGLAPGDAIDFQNQPNLAYTSAFNGTFTNITVSSESGTVGQISLIGNVQLGPAIYDGNHGTEIVVQGTQPLIHTPALYLWAGTANDIGFGNVGSEYVIIQDNFVEPNGYQGTTLSAASITDQSTGQPYSVISVPFMPSAQITSGFEGHTIAYDPSNPADDYMIQPWTLTFGNGTATETATTPSLVGWTLPPFASNVTISGTSTNPIFTWNYPSESINGVGFNIFDDTGSLTGGEDEVFSASISGNTGYYTVPTALDGGLTLQQGHHYTLELSGVVSRDSTQPLSQSNTAATSASFFDFESIPGETVPTVYLPTITPAGAYTFNMTVVNGQTVFIDPSIATGYRYATGAGNPNFTSVLLPAIQTTPYTVSFQNNGAMEADTVAPNTVFTFSTGGVNTFTVTGVNVADDLDPANATAFVTGLTFVSSGSFTGTQTPIVTLDPGPTAGNSSVTEGRGETVNLTALINGLITPGLPGDTETLTSVSAVSGSAVLGTGNAVTYTAPASGPDTISYTVQDELGDTATGQVAVTVNGVPVISAPVSATVIQNQATAIGGVSVAETGNTTTSGETFTAMVSDANGVLSANTGAPGGGGTITPSNGGTTLTISGTLAQVDADLTTLADDDASAASDTITVSASDSFGNTANQQSITIAIAAFAIDDLTTGVQSLSEGTPYTGPVSGLVDQFIYTGADNMNVAALVANTFIHTGGGEDAIDVSHVGGTNVMDGGTNSNFLVGGTGASSFDTFFVDDRGPSSDIWSTVANFHAGDAATIFGITQTGFNTAWVDGQGATGYTGLTLHVTAPGVPTASLTLSGYTTAALTNGTLTTSYGTENDGTPYLYVHANS